MRRLTPLLTNLGVASVFRLLLPMTFAAGGERYLYYTMSLFFPYAKCPSYQCFRFLPALIPSLLPLAPVVHRAPARREPRRLPGRHDGDADRFLLDAIAVPEPGVPVKIAVNWRGALALVDSR
jgi:hypothetical protein